MKKVMSVLVTFAAVLLVCGCGSTTSRKEQKTTIEWNDNAQYAVAFLGYMVEDQDSVLRKYAEVYLPDTSVKDIPIYEADGDELYLIVPRSTAVKIEVYERYLNDQGVEKGEKLFDVPQGSPFVIQCNLSELYSNCSIELTEGEQTIDFSPFISLKDGTLSVTEQGQDITIT